MLIPGIVAPRMSAMAVPKRPFNGPTIVPFLSASGRRPIKDRIGPRSGDRVRESRRPSGDRVRESLRPSSGRVEELRWPSEEGGLCVRRLGVSGVSDLFSDVCAGRDGAIVTKRTEGSGADDIGALTCDGSEVRAETGTDAAPPFSPFRNEARSEPVFGASSRTLSP
jgi:hypothetical protein